MGLTKGQIAEIFQLGGLEDITAADVTADPMDGIASLTDTITAAQVVKLRASIATYAFLRIINGSEALRALTGTELYTSATDTENGAA